MTVCILNTIANNQHIDEFRPFSPPPPRPQSTSRRQADVYFAIDLFSGCPGVSDLADLRSDPSTARSIFNYKGCVVIEGGVKITDRLFEGYAFIK